MGHRDVTVRMAKNDDGDAVERLMDKNGSFQWENWSIDWHDLEPNWLVAEKDGDIIGCIQVVPARPIGRMEILSVDPDLGAITKTIAVQKLVDHAIALNWMHGAQAVSAMISCLDRPFLRLAEKQSWVPTDEGTMIIRRLA